MGAVSARSGEFQFAMRNCGLSLINSFYGMKTSGSKRADIYRLVRCIALSAEISLKPPETYLCSTLDTSDW